MNERKTWFCDAMDFRFAQRVELALRGGKIQRFAEADLFRHGGVNQRVERIEAEQLEHLLRFGGVRADVAADKFFFFNFFLN